MLLLIISIRELSLVKDWIFLTEPIAISLRNLPGFQSGVQLTRPGSNQGNSFCFNLG